MGHFYTYNPRTNVKERVANAEFYPAYLFIPEGMLGKYPSITNSITRYPRRFLTDQGSRNYVATDNFILCIIDCYAYLAWPAMAKMFGLCKNMECYSGYDIAWQIAHSATLWIATMEEEGILPRPSELFSSCGIDDYCGFITREDHAKVMDYIVPIALKNTGMDKVIKVGMEYRCIEDFEICGSNKKTDFYRKWYHSRTKLYREFYRLQYQKRYEKKTEDELITELMDSPPDIADTKEPANRNRQAWNTIHIHGNPEPIDKDDMINYIETKVAVNDFLMMISQEDYDLLMMGFHGKKQKEIAEALNLETHSAVSKRRKRLIAEFEEFSGIEINKKAIRRKNKM